MSRISEKINEIVGIKDGELVILEELFAYDDSDFKGATGYTMRPLTQKEIDDGNDIDYLVDEYDWLWRDAVAANKTDLGLYDYLQEWVDACGYDGLLFPGDDYSYRSKTELLVERLPKEYKKIIEEHFGEQGEDYETWIISSCGRVFSDSCELDVVLRPDLMERIKEYEGAKDDRSN